MMYLDLLAQPARKNASGLPLGSFDTHSLE
jgi:hypothetical protein